MISFKYSQILPTGHPNFEVTVVFSAWANVIGDEVELLKVMGDACTISGSTAWQALPLPNESTHAGAVFAGQLREAARDEAHRIKEQAVREAAQKQTV